MPGLLFERRGWIKPAETEEDKLMKQHPRPVVPKSLQSTIPAVLKKLERTYKAPAHITANDQPKSQPRLGGQLGPHQKSQPGLRRKPGSQLHPKPPWRVPGRSRAFDPSQHSSIELCSKQLNVHQPLRARSGLRYYGSWTLWNILPQSGWSLPEQ
ncbi:hypothetical protein QBC45DRAFT_441234 [Copromyces sp. CBS 386.78]|nr:hypothetical protein QBC45DRAFT_441234 [Copromyces sp. CBS 386.78]